MTLDEIADIAVAAARHAKLSAGFGGRFMFEPESFERESTDDHDGWEPDRLVYVNPDGEEQTIADEIDPYVAAGLADVLNAARDWSRAATALTQLMELLDQARLAVERAEAEVARLSAPLVLKGDGRG